MGRTIFTMTDEKIGPITEQPEAKPEGAEIIPGPSANANGKWAAPLNPCGNPMACLKVYFCLPCTICDVGSYSGMNACLACCCYGYCAPCIRRDIRRKHGIEGSLLNDCLITYFCACCALVQMSAETKKGQTV